jgi:hypothetical protein
LGHKKPKIASSQATSSGHCEPQLQQIDGPLLGKSTEASRKIDDLWATSDPTQRQHGYHPQPDPEGVAVPKRPGMELASFLHWIDFTS